MGKESDWLSGPAMSTIDEDASSMDCPNNVSYIDFDWIFISYAIANQWLNISISRVYLYRFNIDMYPERTSLYRGNQRHIGKSAAITQSPYFVFREATN